MNSKERFDFYVKSGLRKQDEDLKRVEVLVDVLIQSLYKPVEGFDGITQTDSVRLKEFGIDDGEPINWGDLKCCEAKKFEDGSYLIIIEEAQPKDCPTLCEYIENFMRSYGWECRVETEW